MAASAPPIDQECVEGYIHVRQPFRLLVLRRPPSRGRIWAPVSGRVEPTDPSFEAAVRREVREETGFDTVVRCWPLGWTFDFDGPDHRRWRLHAFGIEVASPIEPRLSDEHDAFDWVDLDEAIRRLHYDDNREATRILHRSLVDPPSGVDRSQVAA